MKKNEKKGQLVSYDENLKKWLGNPAAAVEYIKACIEDSASDMPDVVLSALREVADIHGMTWLSKQTGINRQALYLMLDPKTGNPSFRNFITIVNKLGMRMTFEQDEDLQPRRAARR